MLLRRSHRDGAAPVGELVPDDHLERARDGNRHQCAEDACELRADEHGDEDDERLVDRSPVDDRL